MHTPDVILAAARQLLDAHGIGGFRLRAVAARAEVSLGTVTYYFPTADALLEALIDDFQSTAWSLIEVHGLDTVRQRGALVAAFLSLCQEQRSVVQARWFRTAREGELEERNRANYLEPMLGRMEKHFGPSGRTAAHAVVLLAMRYALHTPEEVLAITGADTLEEGDRRLRVQLQRIAEATLSPAA